MTQVNIIKNPSVSQLDEMVQLMDTSFGDNIAVHAMSGGVASLKRDNFRLTIQAAVLEGVVLVCQEPDSEIILSVGIIFGPGTGLFRSKVQLAIPGVSEFFENLPVETQEWWKNVNGPLLRKLFDECIGHEQRLSSWKVIILATEQTEQKKGYGSLIMQEICRKAAEDKTMVTLVTFISTVKFYENIGFKIAGSADWPSPFGSWKYYVMTWDSKLQQTEPV